MAVLNTWALTTLADVKESLGISAGDTSKDNLIIRKINQATDAIENYCGLDTDHHLAETTYTNEEYDGTGTRELFLRAKPVTAVSNLAERGTTENSSDWSTISTSDYFIGEYSGLIKALFTFSTPYNLYRISYTAGFATIPSDLAEACVMLVAYLVDNSATGSAVKSKHEGRRSIEYFQPKENESLIKQLGIDDILDRYIAPSLAGW